MGVTERLANVTFGLRRFGLVAVLGLLGVPVCSTVASAQQLWGEISLPGGTQAARELLMLGADDGRAAGDLLLDFGRRYYEWKLPYYPVPRMFVRYLSFLQSVNDAAQDWPDGCRLHPPTASRQQQDRVKGYIEQLGLRQRNASGTIVVELGDNKDALEKAKWLRAASIDIDDLVRRFNGGDAVKLKIPTTPLPLPLPGLWKTLLPQTDEPALLRAIVGDRSTWLLYAGVMALDDDTLRFIATKPQLVHELRDEVGPAFAAFGRSLRIHDLRVDTPGGAAAVPVWEALTGSTMSSPDRFARDLLGNDDGRLAWFYDTVDHLDGPHQAFVLGAHMQGRARIDFVRAVYHWFAHVEPTWKITQRPFFRGKDDPAVVLASVDVHDDGSLGPPWWPALFAQASDSSAWLREPDGVFRNLQELPADAAWALQWIFERPDEARDRFRVLRFAQRRFATVPRADAPRLLLALTVCREMPALALSLERMGVLDVGVYADIGRAARTLTSKADLKTRGYALAEWQGALALVEQIQRRHHLPPDRITPLLQSLVKSLPNASAHPDSAVPIWLFDTLLPAFQVEERAQEGTLELTALDAFARKSDARLLTVSWEGQSYVLDVPGITIRDVAAIRASTPGPTLDTIAGLLSVRRRLELGLTPADAKDIASRLGPLVTQITLSPTFDGRIPPEIADLRDTAASLVKINDVKNARAVNRLLPTVVSALDYTTSLVLPALVYALAVAPTSQPPAIYAGQSIRHRFDVSRDNVRTSGVAKASAKPPFLIAWRPPVSLLHEGGGAVVEGSLLLVDYALAESQVRTLVANEPTSSPTVFDEETASLVQTIVAYADAPLSKADTAGVVESIARGRALVDSWRQTPLDRSAIRTSLRAAGVDATHINIFEWEVEREQPGALDALTLSDLTRLGAEHGSPGFGFFGFPLDGCACFERPPSIPQQELSARVGLAGASFTDLPVRLLEHLASLGVSGELMPVLLTGAMRDMQGHAQPFLPFDQEAYTAWTRRLQQDRVEEYLLGLVAAKLLVPPSGKGEHP
jgi:hypothetical protein